MLKVVFSITLLFISQTTISQNVGIGVTNPTRAKFELNGAVGKTSAIFGGDLQGISIQKDFPALGFNQYHDGTNKRYIANGFAGWQWYDATSGSMYFESSPNGIANNVVGTPVRSLTVSNLGRIGIGMDPVAGYKLVVARGTGNEGTAIFRGSQYNSHINYSTTENTYIRGGKVNSMVQVNYGGGGVNIGSSSNIVKVGINSGNPFYAMEMRQVNGRGLVLVSKEFDNWHYNIGPATAQGSYQRFYFNEAANPIGSFHPQTGYYSALSDKRAKYLIEPIGRVSNKLNSLRPVSYQMKQKFTHSKEIGFIAQEVKEVFPELVLTHTDKAATSINDVHAVNYAGFAVYAIKTIQEQQQIIDRLKSRLSILKSRMEVEKD